MKNQHQVSAQPQAQNNPPEPQPVAEQTPKPPNLPQPESEMMRKLRAQIRDTQTENEKAVEHVKTLEAETVKISGLFAGLSSRLIGLENRDTNCVDQSGITATAITNMKISLEQDRLQRQQEMKAMITLLSTFQPNPAQVYQLPNYQQHHNVPPYPQESSHSIPTVANNARRNSTTAGRETELVFNRGRFSDGKTWQKLSGPGTNTQTPQRNTNAQMMTNRYLNSAHLQHKKNRSITR